MAIINDMKSCDLINRRMREFKIFLIREVNTTIFTMSNKRLLCWAYGPMKFTAVQYSVYVSLFIHLSIQHRVKIVAIDGSKKQ